MKMLSGLAIALLASSAAIAEPEGGGGGMSMQMKGGGHHCVMMQRTEGALAFLKTELKIVSSQERAWDRFAEAYRDAGGKGHGEHEKHGDNDQARDSTRHEDHGTSQTFLEKAGHHLEMMDEHHETFKAKYEAAKNLYNALNANQRKTADELLPHFVMPHHGGMM